MEMPNAYEESLEEELAGEPVAACIVGEPAREFEVKWPKRKLLRVRSASWLHVTPEARVLMRVLSCGDRGWTLEQDGIRFTGGGIGSYEVRVELGVREESEKVEGPLKWVKSMDADCCFALQSLLPPPLELDPRDVDRPVADWVKLDELIASAGWVPKNRAERLKCRERMWHLVQLVARLDVRGKRPVEEPEFKVRRPRGRFDPAISGAPWIVMDWEPGGYRHPEIVPERVCLARTSNWSRLLGQPESAEWVPWRDRLCRIPGGRTPGAWARVMGLQLAGLASWRGSFGVSRRNLLCTYRPTMGAVETMLADVHSGRVAEYFDAAMGILCESGVVRPDFARLFEQAPQRRRIGWEKEWFWQYVTVEGGLLRGEDDFKVVRR